MLHLKPQIDDAKLNQAHRSQSMCHFFNHSPHSLLRKYVPSYRFIPIQACTIDWHHAQSQRLNPTSIKVLNWNVAKNNHHKTWQYDFIQIVNAFQPDLIFLQEVQFGLAAEHAIELVDMSWNFAPNFMDAHHQAYAGVLTAAKTQSIASQAIITTDYEPVLQTPKVSLVTEYQLPHQTLLAINSHLINFVNLDKFRVQLHELENTIAHHQGAILFAGDFNTWNQARAELLHQVADRLGLAPVWFPPHEQRKIKRFLFSPALDYIFYRGLNEKQGQAQVLDHISSSDHNPLLAEFFLGG